MNTQELKDLIAAKIAWQGTMVDVGGALPTILNEIVDILDSSAGVDIVTSISAQSTDEQVPSAKCMYSAIGNVESLLAAI